MTDSMSLTELAAYVAARPYGSISARFYHDRVGTLVPGHSDSAPVRLMTRAQGRGRQSYQTITQHALDNGLLEIKSSNGRYLPAAKVTLPQIESPKEDS